MKKQFLFLKHLSSVDVGSVKTESNNIIERLKFTNLEAVSNSVLDWVCVVLPDHMVSTFELNLNTRNQSQLNKVARFAVEEKFPGRLEEYHIVSNKSSNQNASVRAIRHSRLKEILELLGQYDISPDAIIAESDLLNKNVCTLLINQEEVTLCGEALDQTYEFDRSVVPLIVDKLFSILKDSKDLHIIHNENDNLILEAIENQAPDTLRIKKIIKDERYFESLCTNSFSNINLLQAEYKTTNNKLDKNSFWKYPIYLATASLLIVTGGLYAHNFVLTKQNNQKEQILIDRYTKLFPQASEARNITDLSIKLKSKQSSKVSLSQSVLPVNTLVLLEKTSAAAKDMGLQFHGFNIDKNSAELLVVGDNVEKLNMFKEKIEQELIGLTVSMDSVTSIENKYQAKLKVK